MLKNYPPEVNSNMPLIDVIIPNWNGREWLGNCLDSLYNQSFQDFEIIVVDNGSTDGSAEFIRTSYPRVKLVTLPENTGFTGGINAGVQAGGAGYVCWFNNDAEAEPDFLKNLLEGLAGRQDQGYGMAAARVTFHSNPGLINSAGLFVGPDGIGRDRGFQQPDGPGFDSQLEIFGPAGVAALYRREIFNEIGLLDETFFLYSEDVDFNFRAQLAGYRCVYVPGARVSHRGSATTRAIRARATRLASRNGLLAVIKNVPGRVLIKMLPWLLLGQLYQLVLFARPGQLEAAIMGKLDLIRLLPVTLKQRRKIQSQRKLTPRQFEQQMKLGRNAPRLLQRVLSRRKG
jgi:hypothetical protein